MSERRLESPRNLTALLVCPDLELSRQLHTACVALPGFSIGYEFKQYPTPAQLSDRIQQIDPHAVILDVGSNRELALRLAGLFLDHWPSVTAVGLYKSSDPDAILQCMRGGCTEFLCSPFPPADLSQAAERIHRRKALETQSAPAPEGHLLCFSSVKGASGASTLAANIANQIYGSSKGRVLLADFHTSAGMISFFLRVSHPYSVLDALKHADELDPAMWGSLVARREGIDLLLAPERPEPAIVEPQPVLAVLEYARRNYDYVVIDLGSVCESLSMATLSSADTIYLVCSADLPSLFMMRRTIPLIEEMGCARDRIRILVNRLRSRSEVSLADMERTFRSSIHATFPDDPLEVQKALLNGVPLAENSELGKQLRTFVKETVGKETLPAPRSFGVQGLKELLGGT